MQPSGADVVVAPYKELGMTFFGSAIKIFEYLSSGRPIVASRKEAPKYSWDKYVEQLVHIYEEQILKRRGMGN